MEGFFSLVEQILRDNYLLSFPLVFISGFILGFSPCFFPVIPVIFGIIGVNSQRSLKDKLIPLLFFVLGISSVYVTLGIISASFGMLFGKLANGFWIRLIMGNIILIFGLSMLGVINLPVIAHSPHLKSPGKNWFFSFLVGIISGLSLGGCLLPVLGSILSVVAIERDLWTGFYLLLAFSMGFCFLFFLYALAGDVFLNLVRQKIKFTWLNKGIGVLLIIVAEYFLILAGRSIL